MFEFHLLVSSSRVSSMVSSFKAKNCFRILMLATDALFGRMAKDSKFHVLAAALNRLKLRDGAIQILTGKLFFPGVKNLQMPAVRHHLMPANRLSEIARHAKFSILRARTRV
jgi:hypothetical protein